jgi:hypothetical protein
MRGKSTLVHDVLRKQHPDLIAVDQAAIRASVRSTPATYVGEVDQIRRLFARENGVSAAQRLAFFDAPGFGVPDMVRKLRAMVDVGVEYRRWDKP